MKEILIVFALILAFNEIVSTGPRPIRFTKNEYVIQELVFGDDWDHQQTLEMDFSTETTWMFSSECTKCPRQDSRDESLFNPRRSKTFVNETTPFQHKFADQENDSAGTIYGYHANDMVGMPWEPKRQPFAVIYDYTGPDEARDVYGLKYNGRIGWGIPANFSNWFAGEMFLNQNYIMCVGQYKNGVNAEITGSWGGYPDGINVWHTSIVTTPAVVPIPPAPNSAWQFAFNSFKFGKHFVFRRFTAEMSTTTAYIIAPTVEYNAIVNALGAKEDGNGFLTLSCLRQYDGPHMMFQIKAKKLIVPPLNYINRVSDGFCTLRLKKVTSTGSNHWILGTPFLDSASFCLQYKNRTIEFAHFYPYTDTD